MVRWLKITLRRLKNVLRWLKITYYDDDYDFCFIYDVLEFKLKNVKKHFEENHGIFDLKYDIDKVNLALSLLNKVKTTYYEDEFLDIDKNDYNKLKEYFRLHHNSSKKLIKNNEGKTLSEIGFLVSFDRHKKAKQLLFKVIEMNIERWWI